MTQLQKNLQLLLENNELVDKILLELHFRGKISAPYLARKFKLNALVATDVMDEVDKCAKSATGDMKK